MDLGEWLVEEYEDITARLRGQVLDLIPVERRFERPGGGNSTVWACFHVARHADLARSVITGEDILLERWRDQLPPSSKGGGGIEEAEQPWSDDLDPGLVDGYLAAVLAECRRAVAALGPDDLDRVPDGAGGLRRAGVPTEGFEWLYRMWGDRPAAFFVRWPVMGHLANHTGELIATRNRMGLSPF